MVHVDAIIYASEDWIARAGRELSRRSLVHSYGIRLRPENMQCGWSAPHAI